MKLSDEWNASIEKTFEIVVTAKPISSDSNQTVDSNNNYHEDQTVIEDGNFSAWWGTKKPNADGWVIDSAMGTFRPHENGWLYHLHLGWLYASPTKIIPCGYGRPSIDGYGRARGCVSICLWEMQTGCISFYETDPSTTSITPLNHTNKNSMGIVWNYPFLFVNIFSLTLFILVYLFSLPISMVRKIIPMAGNLSGKEKMLRYTEKKLEKELRSRELV